MFHVGVGELIVLAIPCAGIVTLALVGFLVVALVRSGSRKDE